MADDTILVDGNVRRATANIDKGDAGLLLIGVQDGGGAGDGFQRDAGHFERGPFDAAIDIIAGHGLAGDDVEIGFQAATGHADRVDDALLHIDRVFLGDHMEDLVSGGEDQFVHIADKPVDIPLADLFTGVVANEHAPVLKAFDVLAGDADVDDIEIYPAGLAGHIASVLNGLDRFFDIIHDAAHDAFGFYFARSQDFELAVLVAFTDQGANFGGTDVERGNDLLLSGISHLCKFLDFNKPK